MSAVDMTVVEDNRLGLSWVVNSMTISSGHPHRAGERHDPSADRPLGHLLGALVGDKPIDALLSLVTAPRSEN
jgi:hypothetical protein